MDPVSLGLALDGCAAGLAVALAVYQLGVGVSDATSRSFAAMCASSALYAAAHILVCLDRARGIDAASPRVAAWAALVALACSLGLFTRASRACGGVVPASLVAPPVAIAAHLALPGPSPAATILSFGLLCTLVSALPRREAALAHEQAELARARADTVLSQIQPHFLYNTLTALRRLCRADAPRASAALGDFTAYLRGNMDSLTRRDAIPFAEELAHTRKYLEFEQLRLGERLSVELDVRSWDFDLPALTLQTLVENAVRHGVAKRPEGGSVRISTLAVGGDRLLSVVDDGVGFDPAAPLDDGRAHIGIEGARLRLDRMCGGTLEIESGPGRGTAVVVTVPARPVPRFAEGMGRHG